MIESDCTFWRHFDSPPSYHDGSLASLQIFTASESRAEGHFCNGHSGFSIPTPLVDMSLTVISFTQKVQVTLYYDPTLR